MHAFFSQFSLLLNFFTGNLYSLSYWFNIILHPDNYEVKYILGMLIIPLKNGWRINIAIKVIRGFRNHCRKEWFH